ncbi:MAG: EAL domain-containing protein, partial [Pseudomonadales bacterium]|nr:EAL domain-containing protein [Pseudomonadales bacterium]
EASIEILGAVRDVGISIAIDDFGTGYSSLSYLQKLPLDILKIDQCFVQRLGQCNKTSALVKAIITIAQAHDMNVVAEGVETKLQLDCIEQLGCSKIQGYYFSKPIPPDLINALLNPQVIPINNKPKLPLPQSVVK